MVTGEIFYGCYWRIEPDDKDQAAGTIRNAIKADDDTDLYDMLDDLTATTGAHVAFGNDDVISVYYGVDISYVNESENKFDEMGLLRVMDLKNGSLRKDVRESMTQIMDKIPVELRDVLTPPVFGIVWSTS